MGSEAPARARYLNERDRMSHVPEDVIGNRNLPSWILDIKPPQSRTRVLYNRSLALWYRACKSSHDAFCMCGDWRSHFVDIANLQKDAATQTDTPTTSTAQASGNFDLKSLLGVTTPSKPLSPKSILRKPTTDDLLYLSPSVSAEFAPKKKKQKTKHLDRQLPIWCTPEMDFGEDDSDTDRDIDEDTCSVLGMPWGIGPTARVRYEDEEGTVFTSSSGEDSSIATRGTTW